MSARAGNADPAAQVTVGGYVDFYGYHKLAGGWMLCGWVPPPGGMDSGPDGTGPDGSGPHGSGPDRSGKGHARIVFDDGEAAHEVAIARFRRDDLKDRGIGVVLFLAAAERLRGRLLSLELDEDTARYRLTAAGEAPHLSDEDIAHRLRPILQGAVRNSGRRELLTLLARCGYTGENTLDRLSGFVGLEIDEAILCPPDGLLLIGWYLAAPGAVASLSLRCANRAAALHPEEFVIIERRDVLEAIDKDVAPTDPNCGFMVFVPDIVAGDEPVYIQVETSRREIGFRNVPPARLAGMAAIRRILGAFELQYDAVVPALSRVIAPALERLNRARLAEAPRVTEMRFGTDDADPPPRCSVIVPLYGRIDFMEYQLALMASAGAMAGSELIYVLDDPPHRREVQVLAESLFLRFGLPFRLLLLSDNVGFAPANNIGLAQARGEFVGFLNSDVFPGTPDWMPRLAARLEADPTLGAVGPLLLFEDGSVQHEGMVFDPVPALGGLRFPQHLRKGWRPRDISGLERQELITGACMVMRRTLVRELGGFDEAYIIGDFEDTDLCLKLRERGLVLRHRPRCVAVPPGAEIPAGHRPALADEPHAV